ncbi:hypothetical protein DMB92_00220 [Campylobacter sp. MIT 99-7217]|uniref:vWA domain-containing protein n=1 Tax=Campylobacter sp. MIT 99-7217 TaxID=535091 RepID=UPI00115BF310|nr:VWA domain-containing protein [Campylobacter sp. MIT 99-7217]TQR34429.1 hypothetical protein DMB92_00220 [Campylobacter sp. MIT 99-7217]
MTEKERMEDLVDNPTPRVAVCLCLDLSYSMSGTKLQELQNGIDLFYKNIKEDEDAFDAVEICIVGFGESVKCYQDFASLNLAPQAPFLSADGGTPMGEGVNLALKCLEERKEDYKNNGVDYYQPWLVLMSDGQPNGDNYELDKAIRDTCDLVNDKKLTVFAIGIGDDADMDTLAKFSPKRKPLKLKGLSFREYFEWLSKSLSRVSQSTPGDKVTLDTDTISDWAEL